MADDGQMVMIQKPLEDGTMAKGQNLFSFAKKHIFYSLDQSRKEIMSTFGEIKATIKNITKGNKGKKVLYVFFYSGHGGMMQN